MSRGSDGPLVQLQDIVLWRGAVEILRGINWTVRAGERWVVLGPNGCGKSMLLRVMLGYEWPGCGRVVWQGVVYGDGAPIPAIREKIGWVGGQLDRELDPGMTCLDAVCTGRVAALGVYGTWTAADLEQAVDLLYQVGAQHLASRPYGLLSSGERQRVMLARAFAANPVLLLLDEPCAGLDPPSRADFLAALSDLLAQPSSPTLVHVTHHVEEITEEISHVALMAHGRLMAQGPIDRVLESGTLSALYGRTVLLERNSLGGWTLAVTPRHGPEVGFSSPVA